MSDELIVGTWYEITLISVDGGLVSLDMDDFCEVSLFEVVEVVGQDSGVVPADMSDGGWIGGEPAADGGSKSGTGRKKRSTDDGCVPANNMSSESTDGATTGYTEVTPVNNDVVVVASTVPISVISIAVLVIVTVCCLRRKRKHSEKDRNVNRSEHETKDSPNEEMTEMMDRKEKST